MSSGADSSWDPSPTSCSSWSTTKPVGRLAVRDTPMPTHHNWMNWHHKVPGLSSCSPPLRFVHPRGRRCSPGVTQRKQVCRPMAMSNILTGPISTACCRASPPGRDYCGNLAIAPLCWASGMSAMRIPDHCHPHTDSTSSQAGPCRAEAHVTGRSSCLSRTFPTWISHA